MLTLLGATGYTGQRIAHALDRAGLPFRLAGRSAHKLAALAASLNSHPPTLIADARQPAALTALFANTRLLINCAGPFTDLGEPVAAHAAASGARYLDISNELAYVYGLRQYHRLADKTRAALVPACGFEVAISDCAAEVLARELGTSLDEVSVTYALGTGAISVGTRRSALRTFATSWFGYRGGKLVGQAPGSAVRRGTMNGRAYAAVTLPSAEIVTIPAHCLVRNVNVWLAVSRGSARPISLLAPLVSWLLRTPLGWLTEQVIQRLAPPGDARARVESHSAIQIEVKRGRRTRAQVWSGRDPYDLTADIVAYAAGVMTTGTYAKRGLLTPAQALEPGAFLEWLKEKAGVRVSEAG
jgi:short subunit dehydrogenase-like uncharacterized protein